MQCHLSAVALLHLEVHVCCSCVDIVLDDTGHQNFVLNCENWLVLHSHVGSRQIVVAVLLSEGGLLVSRSAAADSGLHSARF